MHSPLSCSRSCARHDAVWDAVKEAEGDHQLGDVIGRTLIGRTVEDDDRQEEGRSENADAEYNAPRLKRFCGCASPQCARRPNLGRREGLLWCAPRA